MMYWNSPLEDVHSNFTKEECECSVPVYIVLDLLVDPMIEMNEHCREMILKICRDASVKLPKENDDA